MRAWLTGLFCLSLIAACNPDPTPRCDEAYNHLIALAKRPPNPEQRARFRAACTDAYDEGRHRCLIGSKSVEEALSCRPAKVRPS